MVMAWVVPLALWGCGDSSGSEAEAEAGSESEAADEAESSTGTDSSGEAGTTESSSEDTGGSSDTGSSEDTDTDTGTESSEDTESSSEDTDTAETTGDPETCGNSQLERGETCDDGNTESGDGCSSSCQTECGYLCLELGEACIPGFNAVQCASPGPPFGQPSPIANTCQLATLSVDGSHIALSPELTLDGAPQHLDAMYTGPSNGLFGFAGDTEDIDAGSRLVAVDTETGALSPLGPSLGVWVMGAAMSDQGELWVTTFDTYELNATSEVHIAQVDPSSGEFLSGPTLLFEGDEPVAVWSIHVSDVAFRFDGAMFVSANDAGPPPPEPVSRYLEVDRETATVISVVEGPTDIYAAGIVFVGEADEIIAMDIRGDDDIFSLDLAQPPTLAQALLYADPIETNSGTADLAGCAKLNPQ